MLISKHRIQRNTLTHTLVVVQFHFVFIVGAVIEPVLYTVLFVCVGPKFTL